MKANDTKSIRKRLAAYSAAAVATAASATTANAVEIVWDIPGVNALDNLSGFTFNMNNGEVLEAANNNELTALGLFRLTGDFNGYIYGPTGTTAGANRGLLGQLNGPLTFTSMYTSNGMTYTYTGEFFYVGMTPLYAGEAVAPGQTFNTSYTYGYLSMVDGQTAAFGLRFELNTGTHYGWAQITRVDDDTFRLHGFGYNDQPGEASVVSNVISGDYNDDGVVDLADYTIWRNTLGDTVTPGTGADGDGNGVIDEVDYEAWKGNFGINVPQAPLAVAQQVPEPSTSLLTLAAGAAGVAAFRRRRQAI